jgi:cytochrome P450
VTTRRAIPRAILTLWEHPDIRGRLGMEPNLLTRFLNEVLRLYPPEPVIGRVAACDTTLGGVPLPAGAVVHLSLAAVNREPGRFAEPERVRLDRRPGHLAFGAGPHRCPGAGIARATSLAALRALLAVMPEFEVVHPPYVRRDAGELGGGHGTTVLEELIVAPGPV